jgi:hypothetical protein
MTMFMLSVHGSDTDAPPPDDVIQQMYTDVDVFNQEVRAAGQWVFGGGLHPASTATVVDATGSNTVTTDGPFIESKEHLGGFWVIKADDLDGALALAARASVACRGPVEVRPFQDDSGT